MNPKLPKGAPPFSFSLSLSLTLSLSISISRYLYLCLSFSKLLEETQDSQPTISLSIDCLAIDVRDDVNRETLDDRDRKLSLDRSFSKLLEERQGSRTDPRSF
jgi:hypothetical protein